MHHEFRTDDMVGSFLGVWRRVTIEPRAFFLEMPLSGGLQSPLVFLLLSLGISGLGFLLIGPRGLALTFPFRGLISAFVVAAILMVVARQLFEGRGDYEASYRVVAYASAPLALFWLPVLGDLAVLYAVVLTVFGLERAHKLDGTRAVLTVLVAAVAVGAVAHVLGFEPRPLR